MNRFAIDVLEEALTRAEKDPIKPTPAVRLVLAWLAVKGVVEKWQVERFWTRLTQPPRPSDGVAPYCRSRDMHIYINRWKVVAAGGK